MDHLNPIGEPAEPGTIVTLHLTEPELRLLSHAVAGYVLRHLSDSLSGALLDYIDEIQEEVE